MPDDRNCPRCEKLINNTNNMVTITEEGPKDVWEGCIQCLIRSMKEYLDFTENGIMKCVCKFLWQGCKCGAMQRERHFKKEKAHV